MDVEKNLIRKHYRSLVYSCYYHYIKKHHPELDFKRIVEGIGLPYRHLRNPINWVSIRFDSLLMERLITETNDQDLAYNAGLYNIAKYSCGPILERFAKFTERELMYAGIPKAVNFFNNIVEVEFIPSLSNTAKKTYTIKPIYEKIEPEFIEIFQKTLPNVFKNIIAHWCAVPAFRYNDPSKISSYKIVNQDLEECTFTVDVFNIIPSIP